MCSWKQERECNSITMEAFLHEVFLEHLLRVLDNVLGPGMYF